MNYFIRNSKKSKHILIMIIFLWKVLILLSSSLALEQNGKSNLFQVLIKILMAMYRNKSGVNCCSPSKTRTCVRESRVRYIIFI